MPAASAARQGSCASSPSHSGMAVDVLVQEVAEPARAARVASLRAEGAQPHEVACLHLHPVAVQTVDGPAFQDIEPVLHDMGLAERNHSAGLEIDDGDMHVVAQVGWIHE